MRTEPAASSISASRTSKLCTANGARRGGAEFLTPPTQHETELRCYLRDPDRHLIEVGQTALPGAGASSCTADARVAVRDPRQTRATGASWGCSPARVYPGNAIHLESCTGCRAEHAGLLEAAGEFADVTPE